MLKVHPERLTVFRLEKGWSPERLEQEIKFLIGKKDDPKLTTPVSACHIRRLERGEIRSSYDLTVTKLALGFGVDRGVLTAETAPMPKSVLESAEDSGVDRRLLRLAQAQIGDREALLEFSGGRARGASSPSSHAQVRGCRGEARGGFLGSVPVRRRPVRAGAASLPGRGLGGARRNFFRTVLGIPRAMAVVGIFPTVILSAVFIFYQERVEETHVVEPKKTASYNAKTILPASASNLKDFVIFGPSEASMRMVRTLRQAGLNIVVSEPVDRWAEISRRAENKAWDECLRVASILQSVWFDWPDDTKLEASWRALPCTRNLWDEPISWNFVLGLPGYAQSRRDEEEGNFSDRREKGLSPSWNTKEI